jgi:prolyl-tRNA synthetase family II
MRWSHLHVPTLREDPTEAEAVSHRLLVRAGFIRQLMAGHYSLLPLAVRVRSKVIAIIREELERIGAEEFLLPAMHPAEIWQRSGRWTTMGEEMFRLQDRKGTDLALGMTHEEIFAGLGTELHSYRQLPQIWYQFQTKFRDEPRPKSGLIRTREFTMKDSYSFDVDFAGLDRSFAAHRGAYIRIFERLGIPAIPVEASSGSMGGRVSTEFMCPTPAGEDLVAICPAGDYAANLEKAASRLAPVEDGPGLPEPERFVPDAAEEGDPVAADRRIRVLAYVSQDTTVLAILRGDQELAEQKLADALGSPEVRPARPEEAAGVLDAWWHALEKGVTPPVAVVVDDSLRGRRDLLALADDGTFGLRGIAAERDVVDAAWADLRTVSAGESCPVCGEAMAIERTVEVGHIFKLGTRYSEMFGVNIQSADGKQTPVVMGSYGIGVERALASIVECHHDDAGIIWPVAVAPFQVAIVVAQINDDAVVAAAEELYHGLRDKGVDVLIDDRRERLGVKFADVELIGVPFRVTVGSRGIATGTAEVQARATGERDDVPLADVVTRLLGVLA